ncbi:hypothetical protein HG531_010831 [Fusarium graminearum]|nr:hypothetical protein HG531_010831 [Fusarium graminearum]
MLNDDVLVDGLVFLGWFVRAPNTASLVGRGVDEPAHLVHKRNVIICKFSIILVCTDVDLFGLEPWEEFFPDFLHCRQSVGMGEVQQILLGKGKLWLPLGEIQRMARGFNFRDDGDTTRGAVLLQIVKVVPGESFVLAAM